MAQQAIVNMPSADVTPKGAHFLMHETQMKSWGAKQFWSGTNFYAYGAGKATEIAITSYNGGSPLSTEFATGIGVKSAPQIFKKSLPQREVKLTFGTMGILNHRGSGFGNFSYAHLSFRVPKLDTRLTGGGWVGTRQLFAKNTGNFLAGVEQPLGKRFVLLGEWFAGNHDFGYFIPGILFHPRKNHFIVAAYKIPNPGNRSGVEGIVLEYGLVWGGKSNESGH